MSKEKIIDRLLNSMHQTTIAQKCPICEGRGFVAGGFYTSTPGCGSVTANITETCRSCAGTGILYVKQ